MKLLLLITVLPLAACTQSFSAQSKAQESKTRNPIVTVTMNNVDTLPHCAVSTEGLTAFLAKDSSMYRCVRGNWTSASPQKGSWGIATRAAVRYNQWEDLHTRKRWAVATVQNNLVNSCNSGWRLPIRDELLTASQHGLFEGIKANGGTAFSKAWALEGKEQRVATVSIAPAPHADENPGVYCVLDS